MNDEEQGTPMDELLIQAARDYNEPGAVPRDEMWAAIAARRKNASSGNRPDASPGTSAPSHLSSRTREASVGISWPKRLWVFPAAGIAAAALIAVGITIGRSTRDVKPRNVAATPAVATQTPAAPSVAKPDVEAPTAVEPTVVAQNVDTTAGTKDKDSIIKSLHDETRKTDAEARRVAQSTTRADSRQLAYRLVVLRHLAGSEALITSFRSSARGGQVDAQTAQWARELLGTTRLLESSPAADDPVMKRLLEDLDLVISQIAQYAARGTYDSNELDLIEQSITQRGVITKLRGTTAPSAARM
ncbi:MAG TPA: hypothetical protein VF159_01715 [Gemmatimonadaceae bacterium]